MLNMPSRMKDLILRRNLWPAGFTLLGKIKCLQNSLLEAVNSGNSCGSQGLASKSSPEALNFNLNQIDIMFGYLNLALHKLFQNDRNEARCSH
jgi:hypothetical protein